MGKLFVNIYDYFEKHRHLFFIILIALFLSAGYLSWQVKLEEDISKILPKDKKIEKLNEVFQNSRFLDKLAVTISLKDTLASSQPDSLVAYADEFVNIIQKKLKPYISRINSKVDDSLILRMVNTIDNHLPVYLDEKDYQDIDTLITPAKIRETLERDLRTLSSPAGFAIKSTIIRDPVGITFLGLKKLKQLQYDESFDLYDNYVVTKDFKHLLIFISPAYPPENTGMNKLMLQKLDSIIYRLSSVEFRNIEASYFGAVAVSLGNAQPLRKDTTITQGITVVFLILFIGFYFRRKRAPLLILLPVLFGALFSLAIIYLLKGGISVIALGTGSVVFGIAVNYSLHIFNHFRHTNNIRQVLRDLAIPMTIGSFTTIGGFLCLQFVKSEMLKDLGLFIAFSLLGASLFSLIFLPHLISTGKEKEVKLQLFSFDKIASLKSKNEPLFIGVIILFTIFFLFFSGKVGFESDMMRMNYMSDKLRTAESNLSKISSYSLQSIYLVTEGKTINEALENNEKIIPDIEALKKQGIVKKYSGVSSLFLSDSMQHERIERWNKYWTPLKKQQLLTTLQKEGAQLKFNASAFNSFSDLLNMDYRFVDVNDMAEVRKNILDDFITEKKDKSTVVTMLKVDRDKKQLIYNQFENKKNVTVIDKQYVTNRLVDIIQSDFMSIAIMTSALVFFVLLLTYGRIELALVSFIPMFVSWIWILGLMSIFDIKFNIINIIISALIFGLGDDYSLFIMDGLLQEYKTGKKNITSYKSSILLSAITITAGLGVLIFAKHPALNSIALISIIGMGCVVLISLILIPFLFNLLILNRTKKKKYPWTFFGFLKSFFAFSYFIFGSVLLTILGMIFVKMNPFNKEKGKLIYHFIISKFTWSLMYIMGNVKKEIINPLNENFSTPAVVICNHQSFLDILSTVMLHPKLILVTNKWVWNSPVFGAVVRMADFYPIAKGVENSIELLKSRVKQGYSVIVFPEGTRSVDGKIQRFHKGAFYLAEKLQLDILPIIIHGTGYTMSKNDFLLKDGIITLKYLPRIKPDEAKFGTGYSEKAKKVGHYFREEYENLRGIIEKPSYFREQLFYNYLYKGPVLEWYLKIKLRLEKNYTPFHELLPLKGKILDLGCGYGFMSYMLHFLSPQREISGIDYDEEKIATANCCFNKDENIKFANADILTHPFEKYDAIIIADVLHYLLPEQQRLVIKKSINSLEPGGTILIRDANKDLKERHKGTLLSEYFSTRFCNFNKTSHHRLSFISGTFIKEIANEMKMECLEMDNTKLTSNIIYILRNKNL